MVWTVATLAQLRWQELGEAVQRGSLRALAAVACQAACQQAARSALAVEQKDLVALRQNPPELQQLEQNLRPAGPSQPARHWPQPLQTQTDWAPLLVRLAWGRRSSDLLG
jgi:hypothetical protein